MFLGEGEPPEDSGSGSPAEARAVSAFGRALTDAAAGVDPISLARELSVLLPKVDYGSLEGQALMDATLALEGLQRSLDTQKAAAIGKLDATDATSVAVGLATKTWKANRTHVSVGSVARELTIARTLTRFEVFARALAEGRISAEHVVALANAVNPRVLDLFIGMQDALVEYASRNRFNHYVAHLRSLVELLDEDGPEPDHGDRNKARMAADGINNLHLVMDLTGADAVTAGRIINDEYDRQYRAAVREQEATGIPIPEAPQLRARAITELLRRGAKANPASPKPAVEAIISVNTDVHGCPTGVHSVDGQAVDPITAAVLLCDAHLYPVVTGPTGNPLNLGRTVRLFTTAQRRAMAVRDGGCIFAACDQPVARCVAHHPDPWELGGRTDIANSGFLCPRHHGLTHANNPWTVQTVPIGDLPTDLREQHIQRATSVGLQPEQSVRIWNGPDTQMLLAQTAADHHGPAQDDHGPAQDDHGPDPGRQRPAA